ncbi:MAG: TIGR04282 family arsenosugar biosynthesis glycosyltransferase [Blastocatellia bacterium]
MREALVVMAKAPREGAVKTRLIGALTAEEAKGLYVAFLSDTFALMEEVMDERDDLSLVLCYTPEGEEEAFEEVEREGSMMIVQRGEDLGARLRNCFADLFAMGFESVVMIGADSPTLPGELIYDAFDSLEDENDVIAGPSTDGGYYLIGMRRLHPRLFEAVPWSTTEVMAVTEARAKEAGVNLIVMPEWYDVDAPEGLENLKEDLSQTREPAPFTRRFLKELAKDKPE